MKIRLANLKDFDKLYEIGKNTPEFKVSANKLFMEKDEFKFLIKNPDGLFLVAEKGNQIVGFVCASSDPAEKSLTTRYANLIYITVLPAFRRQGIAQKLYNECEKRMKKSGFSNMYCWAHAGKNSSIIEFMCKQGFAKGHDYVWMDKSLDS